MENNSMLPQPMARPGALIRPLNEVSSSEHNSRNAMLPPTTNLKRQASNLPEPAAKRQTLAERAGEPVRSVSASSRPTPAIGQSSFPSSAFNSYRSASATSTQSSRSETNHSRSTSHSSFTGSIVSGIKPPSAQSTSGLARTKTALGKYSVPRPGNTRPIASTNNNEGTLDSGKSRSKDPFLSTPINPRSRCHSPSRTLHHSKGSIVSLSLRRRVRPILPHNVIKRRDMKMSLNAKMESLNLDPRIPALPMSRPDSPVRPGSPSKLPLPVTPVCHVFPDSRTNPSLLLKSPPKIRAYLTNDSNIENFDPDEPYKDFHRMFEDYKIMYQDSLSKAAEAKEESSIVKETMSRLQQERASQVESIISLTSENQTLKYRVEASEQHLTESRRENDTQTDDLRREHQQNLEHVRQEHRSEMEQIRTSHREELRDLRKGHEEELDRERSLRLDALSQVSTQGALEKQRHQTDLDIKDQEVRTARLEVELANAAMGREKEVNDDLRKNLSIAGENVVKMEASREALQAKIAYLESDSKSQSEAYAEMERRMNEAIIKAEEAEEKLRKEETIRRRLHNQVQELKGNIRVFCRVRPTLGDIDELAKMRFPDMEESTQIEVKGLEETSSLGKVNSKTHPFSFDRVFDPSANNSQIFEEISQLIQSALDGYNVCIFAYGQTGSGKTFTMSADDGMIPRALRQIYATSKELETRGWKYSMEGSFIEVYNEEIRDLLGDGKGTKKHEVRHDMTTLETTITDVTTLNLDSQDQVESILDQAMTRRSVAATQANERSSRSHSVFILKLVGHNTISGETSKGTLNLVDLAGSERLSHSKVEGQRLKETQSINKSLSCLGDVIGALGQQSGSGSGTFDPRSSTSGAPGGSAHIPYRNSKLTYLLQFSLGGNSKTLMFVMVAPEKKCLSETLTSLRFAEKVAKTKVGVAKRVRSN